MSGRSNSSNASGRGTYSIVRCRPPDISSLKRHVCWCSELATRQPARRSERFELEDCSPFSMSTRTSSKPPATSSCSTTIRRSRSSTISVACSRIRRTPHTSSRSIRTTSRRWVSIPFRMISTVDGRLQQTPERVGRRTLALALSWLIPPIPS